MLLWDLLGTANGNGAAGFLRVLNVPNVPSDEIVSSDCEITAFPALYACSVVAGGSSIFLEG